MRPGKFGQELRVARMREPLLQQNMLGNGRRYHGGGLAGQSEGNRLLNRSDDRGRMPSVRASGNYAAQGVFKRQDWQRVRENRGGLRRLRYGRDPARACCPLRIDHRIADGEKCGAAVLRAAQPA